MRSEAPSDEDLARAARAGDFDAFEELVTRYEGRIFQYFRYRTRNSADAEDLTQQVFVKAYRGLNRFDPSRTLAPWLFAIAGRCAVSHYRLRSPERREPLVADEPVDERSPDVLLGGAEAADRLWRWVQAELSETQFTVFWLRVHEDLSVREVAEAAGLRPGNVKVILHRARQCLRRACTSQEAPEGGHMSWPASPAWEGKAL